MFLKKISIVIPVLALIFMAGCDQGGASGGGDNFAGLNTKKDSVSYSLGVDIGRSISTQGWDIDGGAMLAGFNAITGGETPLLSEDQCRQIIMNYQREEQQAQQEKASAENMKKGEEFLANNRGNSNIKELPSGLQYEVMAEGAGESPTLDDQVRIHYKGTLIDGTTFDSSYDRGEPAVFQPRGLIKAWQEILPMMKPGAKYKIYSPPQLAYGEFGSPPRIGPNETLIFEMELFEVIKQQ